MDATKPSTSSSDFDPATVAQPNPVAVPSAAAPAMDSTAPTMGVEDSKSSAAKKPKKVKSSEGRAGKKDGEKKSKPIKKIMTESELAAGISKPATRRLFRQVPGSDKLRLAGNTTPTIQKLFCDTTKRLVQAATKRVQSQSRQTMYLCDVKAATAELFPHVSVF